MKRDEAVEGSEYVTRSQAMQIAKEGGQAAAVEILTTLGINTSSQDAIIDHQVDFAYLRRSRKGSESAQNHAKKIVMGLGVTGVVYAIWEAIKFKSGQ